MAEATKKNKVLLIEDDLFMLELLANELNRSGFEVGVGKTGKEGVEQFQKMQPEVVLLDLILPDEHGFDVLKKIRKMPGGSKAKIMILSNVSESAEVKEADQLGIDDYLVKVNYSIAEIVEKIKKLLGL